MHRIIALLLTTLILLPVTSFSQTRKRSTKARPNTAQQKTIAQMRTEEIRRHGATRVAEQIKILTRFIYLLGGVAKTLEGVNEAARRSQPSAAATEQTEKSKAVIRNSIRDVRVGLDQLEIEFRATQDLQRYYLKLAGVAAGAATAEEQAAANQFDKAGRTLLDVVGRLTDTLLEMR